jgi:hypothetical protein
MNRYSAYYIEILRETEKAILLHVDSGIEVWLPKSLVELYPEKQAFVFPGWLGKKNGLMQFAYPYKEYRP